MKTAIIAWAFNAVLVFSLYHALKPDIGYTNEQRAGMERLLKETDGDYVAHLSVADIGLDAEQFMDEVR